MRFSLATGLRESKELCRNLNRVDLLPVGGSPAMPNTPVRYIEEVKNREIYDPVPSFQLFNGFHVRTVLTGYLPVDAESKGFATLLEWVNLDYVDKTPSIGGSKNIIRLGNVLWQLPAVSGIYPMQRIWTSNTRKRPFLAPVIFHFHMMQY
ncbi:MAG: hypothetical protein PHF31_09055 [Methylobacter sp.]|nr:hypothetical protein [Methylobacter sp.]